MRLLRRKEHPGGEARQDDDRDQKRPEEAPLRLLPLGNGGGIPRGARTRHLLMMMRHARKARPSLRRVRRRGPYPVRMHARRLAVAALVAAAGVALGYASSASSSGTTTSTSPPGTTAPPATT